MPCPDTSSLFFQVADSINLTFSASQDKQLKTLSSAIQQWNRVYNVTAAKTSEDVDRHIVDCLRAMGEFHQLTMHKSMHRVLDLGSGAGLPGLVAAIMFPNISMVCVDKVSKKVAFLQSAIAQLGLPHAYATHVNVTQWKESGFDLIISRAVAQIHEIIAMTSHLLHPKGVWFCMKGRQEEVEKECAHISEKYLFHVKPLPLIEKMQYLAPERHLVLVENVL